MRHLLWLTLVTNAFGQPPAVDVDGDPLPKGAVSRIGSKRFQECSAARVSVSSDGSKAICQDEYFVRVWDLKTGRLLERRLLPGDAWQVTFASKYSRIPALVWGTVTADGARAIRVPRPERAAAFGDPSLQPGLRDTKTGKTILELKVPGVQSFARLALSDDGSKLASIDYTLGLRLRVWDVETGAHRVIEKHNDDAEFLAFIDGNRKLLAKTRGGDWLIAYDLESGKEAYQTRVEKAEIKLSPGGKFFLTSHGAYNITVYSSETGKPVANWKSPDEKTYAIPRALSADGSAMVCVRVDDVAVWDFREGKERFRIGAVHHLSPMCFGPRDETFVAAGRGLYVFDAKTGKQLAGSDPSKGVSGELAHYGWHFDGKSICVYESGVNKQVIYDSQTGKQIVFEKPLAWFGAYFLTGVHSAQQFGYRVDPTPPFRRAMDRENVPAQGWSCLSGDMRLQSTRTVQVRPIRLDIRSMQSTGYSPPEPPPKVCSDVSVYDRFSGTKLFTHTVAVSGEAVFSRDNRYLAILEPRGFRILDSASGDILFRRDVEAGALPEGWAFGMFPAFSPDGKRLAVNNRDGTLLVWDVPIQRKAVELKPADLEHAWEQLGSDRASLAWQAVFQLLDDPKRSIPFLLNRAKPVTLPSDSETSDLLDGLDHAQFRVRETAMSRVLDLGPIAKPFIEKAMKGKISAEQLRRLEALVKSLPEDVPPRAPELRLLRAIATLEHAATPESRKRIEAMAEGVAASRVTIEAKATATRLLEGERAIKSR